MRVIEAQHVARLLGRYDATAIIADIDKASALKSSGERERASLRAEFLREIVADLEALPRVDIEPAAHTTPLPVR